MPLTKLALCPACGYAFNSAALADEADDSSKPSAGDVCICLKCAHVMAYTEDLGVRELTPAEQDEVAADTEVQRGRYAVALTNLNNPWPKAPKGN